MVQKILNESGSNFLIKHKTNGEQIINCDYTVEANDFELRNIDGADYFFALENNFLILDNGTDGSTRSLIVYDLSSQKKVFTSIYFGVTDINENQVTYWTKSDLKPSKNNCSNLNEYLANGGSAVIQKKIILNLNSLVKQDIGEVRCSYSE